MATKKPMGIGVIGQPDVNFKRKFRYTLEIFGFCRNQKNVVPEHFVQTAGRPSWETEETEVNHLNAKMFITGKTTWNTISVTYMDVAHDQMRPLYNWLATVNNFTDPVNLTQGTRRDYEATGVLTMYDGCGNALEQWTMQNLFPTSVNFGDLDYSSTDIATIELTLRYWNVSYRSLCPNFQPEACCTPCGVN